MYHSISKLHVDVKTLICIFSNFATILCCYVLPFELQIIISILCTVMSSINLKKRGAPHKEIVEHIPPSS